jgi:hypothetical protein
MMFRLYRGVACFWLAWRLWVPGVWPGREGREEKRNRGQDESDGPVGVYAVGLARVFPCSCEIAGAALLLEWPPRLVFVGTIAFAGPR